MLSRLLDFVVHGIRLAEDTGLEIQTTPDVTVTYLRVLECWMWLETQARASVYAVSARNDRWGFERNHNLP